MPQLLTLAAIVSRHRLALAASYAAGALLVMWIIVQVLVFQRYFVLQPLIAVLGATEALLAWWWLRSAPAPALP